MDPRTLVSRETTWLMSWPDGVRYSCPPQSLVVSLLLFLVRTLVFSRTEDVLSHLNSSIHRFPRFPPRNLCSLVMLAVFSLVYAAMDTAFFWVLISLGLAESRILPAVLADTRLRTPLISFCTVHLRSVCAAHSLATLYLFTTFGPGPGELPGFWGSMVFRHAPIPRKGSGNQQQQQIIPKNIGKAKVCLLKCLFIWLVNDVYFYRCWHTRRYSSCLEWILHWRRTSHCLRPFHTFLTLTLNMYGNKTERYRCELSNFFPCKSRIEATSLRGSLQPLDRQLLI